MDLKTFWLCSVLVVSFTNVALGVTKSRVLMCYYFHHTVWRSGDEAFEPTKIDPKLCTHVIYAFAGIDGETNKIKSLDPWNDLTDGGGMGNIQHTANLKQQNPDLKVLISLGGWSQGAKNFSIISDSTGRRKILVASIIEFLREHQLDGVDLNWQYPAYVPQGGRPEDKHTLVSLLQDLKQSFERSGYILTIHMNARKFIMQPGYDIPAISRIVDYMLVHSFEYFGPWEKKVKPFAPLRYKTPDASVEFTFNYLISQGASPEKLVMGISTNGYEYLMDNEVSDEIYYEKPANQLLPDSGAIPYYKICLRINTNEWTERFDEYTKSRLATKGKNVMVYEDIKSVGEKINYLKSNRFAGVMIWSMDSDDFTGRCGEGKFPFIKAIKSRLFRKTQINSQTVLPHNE